jgi:hypothetical protein
MRVTFLAILALVLCCSSARAGTILGVLYNQDVSGYASVPNTINIELTAGNYKWVLPPIGVADVEKVFTASAATVGDYPQLDWDQLSYLMTYDKPVTFTFNGNTTSFSWKPTQMYANRFLYSNWEAGFTQPNIYFSSIDRIEIEIAMLSFNANPNNANGVIRWRIYGEPTSVPEPSTALLCALGGVLVGGPLGYRRTQR